MIEDKELAQLFKAESEEHLARLDDGLLRLEKTPADPALLEEVFRESHSLKGAARMLGLSGIETAAHGLESIFNAARKGEAPLTPEMIEQMNAALGDLGQRVQEALAGEATAPPSEAPSPTLPRERGREMEQSPSTPLAGEGDKHPHPNLPPVAARGIPAGIGTPAPRSGETGEGATSVSQAGKVVEPPSLARSVEEAPNIPPPPLAGEGRGGGNAPAAAEPFRIETVRVETRKLDELLTQVGELSVIQGRLQHRLGLMEELLEQWAMLQKIRRGRQAAHGEEAAMARFGGLLGQARDALFDDSARLESTVNLIEDQVRTLRLLPLSTVFALFPRMARDLAREQGKEAELAVEGGDITVDKRILEEMKDPLMHLVRNAIDHGVEPPGERERLGKARSGTVRIRATKENGSVLLEVSDDGRGLDLEAIRRTAAKRGLHDEETLAAMSPAQLRQLIFLPGFSTSTYVTEVSGRGVGLDVVRVNVERLKGDIRLESAAGEGLTVQLRLPLSLATTRLLLASAGGRLCGLPVESVHTSRRVREADIFTLEGRPAVSLDGQPVIAARLSDLLELPAGEAPTLPSPASGGGFPFSPSPAGGGGLGRGNAPLACIFLQLGDERLGLLAEDLLAEEEVVPKPLGAPLQRVRNVSALAMLGSGDICTVLNPADLLRSAHKGMRRAEPTSPLPPRGGEGELPRPAILLVEDSALIRAMEKRILEDAGYEVTATVDGLDALNALGGHPFAAVVSDIMMPNLDGLALTARIRAEPRYKELPVILVTALASDEDKRRGLEAGANAYIPKPSFDQRVLLETLKRLIVT